ncbi:MAG TPA: O-antigen ligase family protein [bacterium]|nr:O-antigen ligase family protein [bacterium]
MFRARANIFDQATCRLTMLILLLGPVFFSLWPFWSLNYGKELLLQFLSVLLVSFFAAGSITRSSMRIDLASLGKPIRLPLVLVLITLVLATVRGAAPVEARRTFFDIVLGIAFMLVLADSFRKGTLRPRQVLLVFLVTGVLNAVMVIAQSIGWDPIFVVPLEDVGQVMVSGRRKVMGFLGNPVFVSEYISALVPFALALLLIARSKIKKMLLGLVLGLFVLAVLLTMTRAPAISIVVGFGVFLALLTIITGRRPRLRKEKVTVQIVFLVVALMYALILTNYADVLNRYSEQGSLERRLSIWSNTKAMIQQLPILGHGLGSFKYLYLDFQTRENLKKIRAAPPQEVRTSPRGGLVHAHNEYLQIAAETGVIGVFSFVFLVVSVFGLGIATLRRALIRGVDSKTRDQCVLGVAALTSIATMLINALTAFPFHVAPTATVGLTATAMLMGLSMKMRTSASLSSEPARRPSASGRGLRVARLVGVVAVLAAGVWVCLVPVKAFVVDYHGYVGDSLRKAGATERALGRYMFASGLDPVDGRLLYKIGLCFSTMGKFEPAQVAYERSRLTYNVPVLLVSSSENKLRLGHVFDVIHGFERAFAYTRMDRYRQRIADIYCELGKAFTRQSRFDIALGCLEEARRLAKTVRVLKLTADVQEQRGTQAEAARTMTEILRMDEFEIETAFKLAEHYEKENDLLKARKYLKMVAKLDPNFGGVKDRISSLSLNLSQRTDMPAWERSKDLYLMGKLSLQFGQYEQASEMFKRVKQLTTKMPQANYFLGRSLEKRGMLEQAQREYRYAFSQNQSDARPLVNLLGIFTATNDQKGMQWVCQQVDAFKPQYELEKSLAPQGAALVMPRNRVSIAHKTLRGVSIDELSVRWEDRAALTIVWETAPFTGPGQDTVRLLHADGTQILVRGRRFLLCEEVKNLIRGREAFRMSEGVPPLAGPGPKPSPWPGEETVALRTSDRITTAVSYSERVPVDPHKGYLLFYRFWASKTGAYAGKEFYDQNGRRVFFNRNRTNERECGWEYSIDYFTPPEQARYVSLFLVMEGPSAAAWFDEILLTSIPMITDTGMPRDTFNTTQ